VLPDSPMKLVTSCAFGLEAIVARELKALGYATKTVGPGQIEFDGDWNDVAKTNLWLRCADRVSISIAEFPCSDFDCLFDTIKSHDWTEWLSTDAMIHVTGSSVKSQLTSVPAVQRTTKKAIVESLLANPSITSLPETGAHYRIHIGLRNDVARLTLDTTGPSLHKRGYREISTRAPLKETMAAALVQLSFWQPGRPLIDPFCGGGTILIEAALLGRNMAPGRSRAFAFEEWTHVPKDSIRTARENADALVANVEPMRLLGSDIHAGALSLARKNAEDAGVANDIHFQQGEFKDLTSKKEFGVIITNPPYGERLDQEELQHLYESIPYVLRALPTWSHYIFTSFPKFETLIGKQADRRRKLYNGRIECTYYQFHGPKQSAASKVKDADASDASGTDPEMRPVFGGGSDTFERQTEIFANRLRKLARHLRRLPKRGITCYRLYERDIPEIPFVVDLYEDRLHLVEFERPHDRDIAQHAEWVDAIARTASETLDVPMDRVFVKSRMRQRGDQQHVKLDNSLQEVIVNEGGLKFLVNLSDYTDTGLFLDHRNARSMIREMSDGKSVLNLFAYTGAFSVYAAAGNAKKVTTVDWSNTYVEWAKRNFKVNGFVNDQKYRFARSDARDYVSTLPSDVEFDLVVCDPPTFSNSKRTDDTWDVQRHHAELINSLLSRLTSDGTIFFSTNFRRIKLEEHNLNNATVREITKKTLPEEFRNQRIHRSWFIRKA